jgi:hypothetical protein
LFTQPSLHRDDQRSAAFVAHTQPLLRRHAIDLAFDGEQGVDAFDYFDGDRRLVEPHKIGRADAVPTSEAAP